MSLSAAPLPPFYYVAHFAAALECLAARDHDLLNEVEAGFMRGFALLPLPQQALIVRMALRRGPLYRGGSLRYPELPDCGPHLAALKRGGWVTDDPVLEVAQLIALLPKAWLAEGFGLRASPALSKDRMLQQAREIYPDPLPLSRTHFRLEDGLYEFRHADTCRRLCALYFGNHEQDWSEYTVADLGIRRYERVMPDSASRPFANRAEMDLFEALYQCEVLLECGPGLQALASLPPLLPGCDWLTERYRHLSLRIARQLEREGETALALEVYQRFESPEAQQRRQIVARRLSPASTPRPRFDHRSVPHFELRLPGEGARRIEYRVAEALARQAPESEVIYAENRLLNALFGLLFWPVVFARIRGAFFHHFHAAPADLYSPQFRERRRAEIDAAFLQLDGTGYRETILRNFRDKAGRLNPFVPWGWLRRPLLERALGCLPARDLSLVFDWMLADLEHNTAGFPDLLQLWPGEQRYQLVEVKLGADRLQPNQRRFLQYAQLHGLPVSVCYVSRPAALPPVRRSPGTSRPQSPTLELFPQEAGLA